MAPIKEHWYLLDLHQMNHSFSCCALQNKNMKHMPGWVFQQSHIHNVATGQEIGEPCRQTRLKAVLGTERFGATGEEDY